MKAICPVCKKEVEGWDDIVKVFGVRKVNSFKGTISRYIPQSYCSVCRSQNIKDLEVERLFNKVASQELIRKSQEQREERRLNSKVWRLQNPSIAVQLKEVKEQSLLLEGKTPYNYIDIFQGLSDTQSNFIKAFCTQFRVSPLRFSVDVTNNKIYYMGERIA